MVTTQKYGSIRLIPSATQNGWYGFGALPDFGVEFNNSKGAVAYKNKDSTASTIEVARVVRMTHEWVTVALTLDLTQMFGLKRKTPTEKGSSTFIGRTTVTLYFGEQESPDFSWVTEDSARAFEQMLKCQKALERNKEFLDREVYFGEGDTAPFNPISNAVARELGIPEEDYLWAGFPKFSVVTEGYGFMRLNAAVSDRGAFIAVIGREPNDEDEYQGAYGICLRGLRVFGAGGPSSNGNKNSLTSTKPAAKSTPPTSPASDEFAEFAEFAEDEDPSMMF